MSEHELEAEINQLEGLLSRVQSGRVWPPLALGSVKDALMAARWTQKAVRLLDPSAGVAFGGGGGVGRPRPPAFADIGALLDSAVSDGGCG